MYEKEAVLIQLLAQCKALGLRIYKAFSCRDLAPIQ